jgi:hypothetical protein
MLPVVNNQASNRDESPRRKIGSLYILRHFRGELAFGVSFWINYVGGLVFFTLAAKLLVHTEMEFSLITFSYLHLFLLLFISIGIPWLMVGTWRSASEYVASGGNRMWSFSVKTIILIGAYYLFKLIMFSTIPMIGEFGEIVTGDKNIPPYDILVHSEGTIIQFRGGLRAGAEREFRMKLESSSRIRVLQIESDGGRLKEGMRIGRMVRIAGLATVVSTHCKSAATFLFISGKERIVTRDAKMGFHRPSGIGSSGGEYENIRKFMEKAGISKDFINRALSTSSDEMWYPTYEEMLQAGVVTGELVDGKIRR